MFIVNGECRFLDLFILLFLWIQLIWECYLLSYVKLENMYRFIDMPLRPRFPHS